MPWRTVGTAGDREHLAFVTYLPLRRFRTTLRFLRLARGITARLQETRELIGFSVRANILSKRFHTLSVWEDERALMDFVWAAPHADTMRALDGEMGDTRFVRWTIRGRDVPPTWEKALQVLATGAG